MWITSKTLICNTLHRKKLATYRFDSPFGSHCSLLFLAFGYFPLRIQFAGIGIRRHTQVQINFDICLLSFCFCLVCIFICRVIVVFVAVTVTIGKDGRRMITRFLSSFSLEITLAIGLPVPNTKHTM